MIDFREIIRRRMEEQRITQRAFCSLVGVHQSSFAAWLAGRRAMPADRIALMLDLLGGSVVFDNPVSPDVVFPAPVRR